MTYSSLLRIRAFRDLWFGQAISQIGDAFYFLIFMFMVGKVTGSVAAVGYVGALESLPFLLFGPYAGVLADRMDRRRVMLLSDIISAITLTLFGLVLMDAPTPPIWLMYVVPAVLSSTRVFFMPAKGAAVPALVPAEQLQLANGLSMVTQNLMPLIGLAISAAVLGALYAGSPKWFFLSAIVLDSASFYVSAAYIRRLPEILPERTDTKETHPLEDFRQGMSFIRKRRDLVVLILLLTVFRLFVAPFFTVYIAANEAWFGGKPQSLAWFEFSFCLGMVVSSTFVGKLQTRRPAVAFSVGLAVVGVSVAFLGLAPDISQTILGPFGPLTARAVFYCSLSLFVFWNLLAGLAVPFADIPIGVYLQLSVPDAYRGRVNSVLQMIATGVMPVGMMLGGVMVQRIGVEAGFLIMGAGMLAACLAGLADPAFRRIRMPGVEEPNSVPAAGQA
jgi:MFS family permease